MNRAPSLCRHGLSANRPILMIGPPGTGKTDLCHQLADSLGYHLEVEVATTADPMDSRGLPGIIDGKATYQPYGLLRRLIEAEEPTICLIDDLGHASGEVQRAYMHLVLARTAGDHRISQHVKFVAATNDVGHSTGVSGIVGPLQSRFLHIRVKPHLDTWILWAQRNHINPEVIGFVRSTPKLFDNYIPPVGIQAICCPRSLHMLSDILNVGANDRAAYSGCIGEENGIQFSAYRELYRMMPSIEDIKRAPLKTEIPDKIDERYALCAALSCCETGWGNIIAFLERLPMELQVMCVQDALIRYPNLKEKPAIREWIKCNREVIL